MGKVRFKLSYVIPHAWCYELEEVGESHIVGHSKAANRRFASKASAKRVPRQQTSVCSKSHRAIDFSSVEMQRTQSNSCADSAGVATRKSQKGKDIAIRTVVDPKVSAGCTCRVSSVVSLRKAKEVKVQACTTSGTSITSGNARSSNRRQRVSCCDSELNVDHTMGSGTDAKSNKDISDIAPELKRTSSSKGICFDARELERKLRTMGFEERRTYYIDWSSGFSSPEIDRKSKDSAFPDYSYLDALREEEIESTKQDSYIGSKLFDKRNSNESNFGLTPSPSGNELDCGTSSAGINEFSSFTSDESLFTTTDEIHSPLLRCVCGLSGKEDTCSINGADKLNQYFGGEISNAVFHCRQNISVRHKSHDKTKESNTKRRHEFTKHTDLAYKAITNSPKGFVDCLSPMKGGSESGESHTFGQGHGAGSRGFSFSESKARILSPIPLLEDLSDFTSIESDQEYSEKRYRSTSQLTDVSHYCDWKMHRQVAGLSHNASETLAQQQENSRNTIFSDFLIDERPSSSQNFRTHDKSELISTAEIMKGVQQLHRHRGAMSARTQTERIDPHEVSSDIHSRVYDSFAMVKGSTDPLKDFKDSMMEMVLEKELHTSEDQEVLLECYLSLNSEKYHNTIIRAFGEVSSEIFQGKYF